MSEYIEVPEEMAKELESCMNSGPIHSGDLRLLLEDAVAQIKGLTVHIYSNEHPPPHFHVNAAGENNAYTLDNCTPMHGDALISYYKNIRKWHKKHHVELHKMWNRLRPDGCTVGKVNVPKHDDDDINA